MLISGLPPALAGWREAPRVRTLNDRPPGRDGRYILCWLQQALRAIDNPVIDAAIRLGNAARLPVLVYHGVRENYPYASARLHSFILGASRDLASGCRERGLAFACHVDRVGRYEKGLVHRLGSTRRRSWSRINRPLSLAGRPGGSPPARPFPSMPSTLRAWCHQR